VLIVAGCIEGFISPSPAIPWQWKFVLAGAIAVIFFSYLFFCARGDHALPSQMDEDEKEPAALRLSKGLSALDPQ